MVFVDFDLPGNYLIIEREMRYKARNGSKMVQARCKCGNRIITELNNIKRGFTKTCGQPKCKLGRYRKLN